LESGPLPTARALEYLSQICQALDVAHRNGVVHRDLKPSNVMLTRSGVKLLDFGAATWSPHTAADRSLLDAPTLTGTGVIVGTLQYMSPEQLEGKPADTRSDIFMLGAMAYEMLSGKRPFAASSQAGIISAVMRDEPPALLTVAPHTPPVVARAMTRCLAKDPNERWQSVADLMFHLQSSDRAAEPITRSANERAMRATVRALPWIVAAAALLWAATSIGTRRPPAIAPQADAPAIRFSLVPPQGVTLHAGYNLPFAVSPDGRHFVFVGDRADGAAQLWLHDLSSDGDRLLAGTEGATTPFWSPDSEWIGFFAANQLKKIHVASGVTQVITSNAVTYGGATWNRDGVIVFPATVAGLSSVSQDGAMSAVTSGRSHFWPQFVGDGTHVMFAAAQALTIGIVPVGGGAPRTLMKFPVRVSALAYVPGFVLYVQDRTLFARPFDDQRLDFSGEPVRVVDGVPVTGPGRAAFSVSAAGVLAYWPYPIGTPAALQWFDRDGRSTAAIDTPAQYIGLALSPDAQLLLFSRITNTGGADIWLRDMTSGDERQLTFDGAAFTPQWSPDGKQMAFTSPGQNPPPKLFTMRLDGAGGFMAIGESPTANFAAGWSGDGQSILSVRLNAETRHDLWIQDVIGGRAERLSLNTSHNESDGKLSPDGQWIAYVTDASGRNEVWVARYPSGHDARQVSTSGGQSPQWIAEGRELVHLSNDKRLMTIATDSLAEGNTSARPLFRLPNLAEVDGIVFPTANPFVAAVNGRSFLAAVRSQQLSLPPVNVVINWQQLIGSDRAR